MAINIAIDGPAGAGKSSIAKLVSKELGYIYVDTGALYRTIARSVLDEGIDINDSEGVIKQLENIKVDIIYRDGAQRMLLNGKDVTEQIRTPEVSNAASVTSVIPEVRAFLLGLQRKLAAENNVVMDGRDIATVVLPDAKVKIFLTASAEERARRRHIELVEKGVETDYKTVLAEIKERDYRDSHREVAPLKCAEGAVTVDTTEKNLEEAVKAVEETVFAQLNAGENE